MTQQQEQVEYVLPTARGRALVALPLVLAISAGLLVHLYGADLKAYLRALPPCELVSHVGWLFRGAAALIALKGALLLWFGVRTLQLGRFPAAGAFVFVRTRVRKGVCAQRLAWTLIAVGALASCGAAWLLTQVQPLFLSLSESLTCAAADVQP